MRIEWDATKTIGNWRKHGVSFDEAVGVCAKGDSI